ncbi:MAG: prolyl oligopeptidase family serine peptidase [Verrucomicrobia bacterium]|nr:prolyl oligopeptidase family serine peptidase [Verrucomicrobiota bacterium]
MRAFELNLLVPIVTLLHFGTSFAETIPGQHPQEFDGTVSRLVHIKYLLFIPDAYGDGAAKRWPLILYLHGGSRRGDDIEKLREPEFGLTALVEKDKSFPFIVLSPQCPEGEYWTDTEALIGLLDEVENKYRVDPARVYLTGHSMGGFGTWYLAYKHPERFAAIAPMSAPFTVTAWASRLKDMAIWAFHGAKDNLVPIGGDEELIDALKSLGNDARFTVLPGRDHNILDAYKNQELYAWFLQHVLK